MLNDLLLRLRSLFRREVVDEELDGELRFHLEQQVGSYVRQGLSRDEAIRRARIEFGGLDQVKEEHRDARGIGLAEDLARDVRYAVRQLRRSPGFALAALLCLGIGIGATTAIYSVVNTILLRPLPFPDSDRFVRLVENIPHVALGRPPMQRGLTYQEFLDWREQSNTLADSFAVAGMGQRLVRTTQGAVGLWGAVTSTNTFSTLQVRAALGRTFDSGDESNPSVVVLSFDTWQTHFNSDSSIVGKVIEFRAGALMGPMPPRAMTVIGVLPADFVFPDGQADFYWPVVTSPGGFLRVAMIGRLARGVSLKSAVAEANAMGATLRPPWPADAAPLTVPRFEVEFLKERAVERARPALQVLLATVIVVLVVVCANVANLLLARATARQREIAVRLAIGASRARVMRQIMTESLVLALAGGAIGALLGAGGVGLVKELATVDAPGIYRLMLGSTILPRAQEVAVDFRVLGISLSLAVITSVVFGMLPALTLSRASHMPSIAARGTTGPAESRIRAALVVGQLVLATILLVSAGLLAHSFVKLSNVNNGYNASNVLVFNLLLPDGYSIPRKAETIDLLLARFRNSGNVQSVGFSRHGLLIGEELFIGPWAPPGRTLEDVRDARTRVRSVSDGYLTAMGVPVLEGREFDARDHATAAPVIVMSRSAARQYFGDRSPVGQVIDWHFAKDHVQPMTVVGVVEDIRQESPTDELFPEIFVDYRQFLFLMERAEQPPQRQDMLAIGFLSFALRTSSDPAEAVPLVRDLVNRVDPNVGIDALVPMNRLTASAVAPQRFYTVMLAGFAAVAGLLAVIGVYGVLTYAVIQRTQEIGIRMAIGAQRGQVMRLVLHKGFKLTALGIALGLVGAAIGTRLLQGMLFGLSPLDPRTFVVVSLTFGLVALVASYLPARRATKVDALVALRHE